MRMHTIIGLLVLVTINAACLASSKEPEIAAFLTSERVVYPFGSPVDLTFSITVPKEGAVSPNFKIEREAGSGDEDGQPGLPQTIEPREVASRFFWETPGKAIDGTERPGSIPAGRQHTETIADLRQWYELDAPGTYRITFDGQWIVPARPPSDGPKPGAKAPRKGEIESHPVTSNTLLIHIARPASEEEPLGEPIEGRVIPLEDIWALDMPRTNAMKPHRRADGSSFESPEGVMIADMLPYLREIPAEGSAADSAFVVRGRQLAALQEARDVLTGAQPRRKSVSASDSSSIVFFSHSFNYYVHITSVQQWDNIVQITYRFVPHKTKEMTANLALIPLAPSSTGLLHVRISPIVDDPADANLAVWSRRIVGSSFSMEVLP